MKKTMKKWLALTLALLLVCATLVPVYAVQDEVAITPRLNTNIDAVCIPNLTSSGVLTVTNNYDVNDSRVTRVVVTTYVEKRSLLVVWTRVDIGTTNDEWVDYGSNGHFAKTHSAQMPSSGIYRVTAIFDVYSGSTLLDSLEIPLKLSY